MSIQHETTHRSKAFPPKKRRTPKKVQPIVNPLSVPNHRNKLVHSVNQRVQRLVGEINELKLPEFGSSLYSDSDDSCVFFNTNEIIASTVADRIISKFEQPNIDTVSLLREQCISDWVAFERDHLPTFSFENVRRTSEGRSVIYNAKKLISQWFMGYKYFNGARVPRPTNFFKELENAPIDFGPGESYSPSEGKTSVFAKINPNTIFPFWTVTIDYSVHAAYLVAANRGLRESAKEFLRKKKYPAPLLPAYLDEAIEIWESSSHPRVSPRVEHFAKKVFLEILAAYPINHKQSLLRYGSRGTSVYKNTKKRRLIEIQCLLNVVGQKLGGFASRQCLKTNAGIDLDDGQQYHRWLISQSNITTFDETNASDSIVNCTISEVVRGTGMDKIINLTRSQFIEFPVDFVTSNNRKITEKVSFPIKKLSSMGNGFTFEMLSAFIGAIIRQFDVNSSVYGDDIICSTDKAESISRALRTVGFIINHKKSFVGKPLRESCGAFYLDSYGYITCFDIKWCVTVNDVINVVNKLGRIVRYNSGWNCRLRDLILECHADLLGLVPSFLRGPLNEDRNNLPLWVEDIKFIQTHKNSAYCKQQFLKFGKPYVQALTERWQLFKVGNYPLTYDPSWVVVMVPSLLPLKHVSKRHASVAGALKYAYLHSGRVVDMQIRQQKDEQVWGFKPLLVHTSGVFLRAGTARRVCVRYDANGYKKSIIRENIRKMKGKRKFHPSATLPG